MENQNVNTGLEIAVIGLAGKFPGARNVDEFWDNLKNNRESITFFSDEELIQEGVPKTLIHKSNYVKAYPFIEEKDCFDAKFFGYTDNEADIMDPQVRIFHETAWEALENAGYNPTEIHGLVGVYTGASSSFTWHMQTLIHQKDKYVGGLKDIITEKDFLSRLISYKFDLNGPSYSVQTACSTSLVAIHLASRALLTGECSMALAGGVSLVSLKKNGYLYEDGLIFSIDGHCKAFDAEASGTVFADGSGVVVLKRLQDAINDRDHIYAVIKGSSINNDGVNKISFMAPSVKGQIEVIRAAMSIAQTEPESISYVETHGTGTRLGDPIEIEGLTLAFNTDKKHYCRIGSVKTNIGHADAAAGVIGFIKTVLSLYHKQIPASLNFNVPNPHINFEQSPFVVNTQLIDWPKNGYPLRAGVNAFGVGGTNAHLILEEASLTTSSDNAKSENLIVLSAKSENALNKIVENLYNYLNENKNINISDLAYTLQVGRKDFEYKRTIVSSDINDTLKRLSDRNELNSYYTKSNSEKNIIFMFSGQGSQYVNMGKELYKQEEVYRNELDKCFEIYKSNFNYDLKEILFPEKNEDSVQLNINQTEVAQPLIFSIEYALAQLLIHWGVKPYAMVGHSIGEYVAACLAGVFSLENAIKTVAVRGKLMQSMQTGSMLSIQINDRDLIPLLNENISLAAVNSLSLCVVAGSDDDINQFQHLLKEKGYNCQLLHTSHPFHSQMMDPMLEDFENEIRKFELNKPSIPYISNLSGTWITEGEATDPKYYRNHLRKTVKFADGLETLNTIGNTVFIEVGPGNTLTSFVKQIIITKADIHAINLIRHPKENKSDIRHLLEKLGLLWTYGIKINWNNFNGNEKRSRIPLPTYPFERKKHWVGGDLIKQTKLFYSELNSNIRIDKLSDWFYEPSWQRTTLHLTKPTSEKLTFLVFHNQLAVYKDLLLMLQQNGHRLIHVKSSQCFEKSNDYEYNISYTNKNDYEKLFSELLSKKMFPDTVLHLWNYNDEEKDTDNFEYVSAQLNFGYYCLLECAKTFGKLGIIKKVSIKVIINKSLRVIGTECTSPIKSTILGAIKAIPIEYQNIRCNYIDVEFGHLSINQLYSICCLELKDQIIAYRGNHWWEPAFKKIELDNAIIEENKFRNNGVYLITGGLGGVGLVIAEDLAIKYKARLILTGRSNFPSKNEWQNWIQNHSKNDSISQKIKKLIEIEKYGSSVTILKVDVTNRNEMEKAIDTVENEIGPINGILHAAGIADGKGIQLRERENDEVIFASKIYGTITLYELFKNKNIDLFVMFSSIASYLTGYGQVGYCAAHSFLDEFTISKLSDSSFKMITINWDLWADVGMGLIAKKQFLESKMSRDQGSNDVTDFLVDSKEGIRGLLPEEGTEVFDIVLKHDLPQVIISTRSFLDIIDNLSAAYRFMYEVDEHVSSELVIEESDSSLNTSPKNRIEKILSIIWKRVFGLADVKVTDDFFELGGDSLKLTVLISQLQRELMVHIPITEVYNNPTIQKLSNYIVDKQDELINNSEVIIKAEKKEYYELSPSQLGLYLAHSWNAEKTTYNHHQMFYLGEGVDENSIINAVNQVVEENEILRTSFKIIKGLPKQVVNKHIEFNVEFYQIDQLEEIDKFLTNFIKPYDLDSYPLFRIAIIQDLSNKRLFLIEVHHIIADYFSNMLLISRIGALMTKNKDVTTPPNIQYKDYSQWYKYSQQHGTISKQQEYWFNKFKDIDIPLIRLPFDFDRPEIMTNNGSFVSFELNAASRSELEKVASEIDMTLFQLILASFYILLHKLSDQNEIIVGSAVSGRRSVANEAILGNFVNVLPLRNFIRENDTIYDSLLTTKAEVISAFENQDYQVDDLIRKLKIVPEHGRRPLFDVGFSYLNYLDQKALISEKKDSPAFSYNLFKTKNIKTKYDFLLEITALESLLFCNFEYNTGLFKEETIKNIVKYYLYILSFLPQYKTCKIKEIKLNEAF